jgi:aryl-alcohol dehydrogenase-like predicted oxidoreductase
MTEHEISRRRFIQSGAATAAAVAGGLSVTSAPAADTDAADKVDTSKILNFHEEMEYRRQGSTGWMVSAVCLGGHSRSPLEQRREIVSRCIDAGINYIDACTKGEVLRDAKALEGRRDKMYLALSHCGREARNEEYRTAKKLLESLDEVLLESKQEYTDLWRITCFEPGGRHTFDTSQEIVEALETAKKQGKARAIGFSSHDRRWIQFMIEYFPEIDCVCFPLKKCDVGAFGIKPFAAGSLFTGEEEEDKRRARLAIRYILLSNTVIPIPGMNRVEHVDNVVTAVKERRELDVREVSELERNSEQMLARLPAGYQWLKDWQYV